jgi:hypothetical protein
MNASRALTPRHATPSRRAASPGSARRARHLSPASIQLSQGLYARAAFVRSAKRNYPCLLLSPKNSHDHESTRQVWYVLSPRRCVERARCTRRPAKHARCHGQQPLGVRAERGRTRAARRRAGRPWGGGARRYWMGNTTTGRSSASVVSEAEVEHGTGSVAKQIEL